MVRHNLVYWGIDLALWGGGILMPDAIPPLVGWALLASGAAMALYGFAGYFLQWPFAPQPSRIPLLDLREIARKKGWSFDSSELEGMDFADGLRQAGVDGSIKFWGRPNRHEFKPLVLSEPLNEIERSHWKDYQIEALTLYDAKENVSTCTYNPSSSNWKAGGFIDLHLNGREGTRWLRKEAPYFKGRRDAQRKKGG